MLDNSYAMKLIEVGKNDYYNKTNSQAIRFISTIDDENDFINQIEQNQSQQDIQIILIWRNSKLSNSSIVLKVGVGKRSSGKMHFKL